MGACPKLFAKEIVHKNLGLRPAIFRESYGFFPRQARDDIRFFLNSTLYILHSSLCHPERSEAFLPVILSGAKRSRRISHARPQLSPTMRSLDKLGMTGGAFCPQPRKNVFGRKPKTFCERLRRRQAMGFANKTLSSKPSRRVADCALANARAREFTKT